MRLQTHITQLHLSQHLNNEDFAEAAEHASALYTEKCCNAMLFYENKFQYRSIWQAVAQTRLGHEPHCVPFSHRRTLTWQCCFSLYLRQVWVNEIACCFDGVLPVLWHARGVAQFGTDAESNHSNLCWLFFYAVLKGATQITCRPELEPPCKHLLGHAF